MEKLIEALQGSMALREAFLANPEPVAASYGVTLTQEQLDKLSLARELESDPLVGATMCPCSGTGFTREIPEEHLVQVA